MPAAIPCPRPGQLRDSGLRRGNRRSPQHHGRAALQLHRRRPAQTIGGVAATNHAEHETIEITQGINDWSEVGFYIFTSEQSGLGVQWVGDHIRPRVRVPEKWRWPVGVSLSTEVGYQRALFSPDTWTWEIRPIVDKTTGRWYFAVNPALERTWHGPDVNLGIGFSPAAKISYDFTKKITGGFEYYADYGSITNIASLHNQQQQLFPAIDLNVSPDWEINFGVGIGPTAATDHWIVKGIIGRRFNWGKRKRLSLLTAPAPTPGSSPCAPSAAPPGPCAPRIPAPAYPELRSRPAEETVTSGSMMSSSQ